MSAKSPTKNLANGRPMPLFGLGTWLSKPNEVYGAVKEAIDAGYRHIDSAAAYGNENETGKAIKEKIDEGVVKREDLFVCTKLKPVDNRASDVEEACKKSLSQLGLDYIDLYLMHWPMTFMKGQGDVPKSDDGMVIPDNDVDYLDTWKAMESLVDQGLVKAIGVSNFTLDQLKRLLALPPRVPVANIQIEGHPYLTQQPILDLCRENNIIMTCYSPLGSPGRPVTSPTDPVLLEDPVVMEIAKAKSRSPAQVLIRYQIDRGNAVIPKSVTPARIRANAEALQFELTPAEVQKLDALNKDFRYIYWGGARRCKHHPFPA